MKVFGALLLFCLNQAVAAPHPATATSPLTDPSKNAFFKFLPFELSPLPKTLVPAAKSREMSGEGMSFASTQSPTASFSIKLDNIAATTTLEGYARRWMKEYPSYGFQVLGTKSLTFKGEKTMVIDMLQKDKQQQIRQLIVRNDRRVAIVTCFETQARFAKILGECNALVENLKLR